MAKRKRKSRTNRARQILGGFVFIAALTILIALVTHSPLDDARITGELDRHLDPFEIQYRNQGGMLGAYLSYSLTVVVGWLAYFLPLGLVLWALRLFSSGFADRLRAGGLIAFTLGLLGTIIYDIHHLAVATISSETGAIGGYLVISLTQFLIRLVGLLGTYVLAYSDAGPEAVFDSHRPAETGKGVLDLECSEELSWSHRGIPLVWR